MTKQTFDSSTDKLSEAALSNIFINTVSSGYLGESFPKFHAIYQEIPGPQGIADFLCVSGAQWTRSAKSIGENLIDLPKGPTSEVLSIIDRQKPRTREAILSQMTYSPNLSRRTLHRLIDNGALKRKGQDGYVLAKSLLIPDVKLFFFELKLADWRRAMRQAIQARVYADRSYIVLPEAKRKLVRTNKEIFQNQNIGVVTLDPVTGRPSHQIRARGSRMRFGKHKLSVLIELARRTI